MYFVLDIQGFRGPKNQFIVKELALLQQGHHYHFILLPPFNFKELPADLKRQSQWLYQNYHGLLWDGGFTEFRKVKHYLRSVIQHTTVYVKGTEKSQWLRALLQNENDVEVINVEDIGCPSFKELKQLHPNSVKCLSHSKCCALQNVYMLNSFLSK